MRIGDVVKSISEKTGVSQEKIRKVIAAEHEVIVEELQAGGKVQFNDLGTFSTSVRAARLGRNPQTGETMEMPESTVVKFKASAPVKRAVK